MKIKRTGVTRAVDNLGRIVIPKEIRRNMKICTGDHLEIIITNNGILLNKFIDECVFCDNDENIKTLLNKPVCEKCAAKLGVRVWY